MSKPKTRKRPELARHYKRWTGTEAMRLRLAWGTESVEVLASRIGRSPITVYYMAQKLKLPLGCPQGFEYLTAAAKRTGFDTKSLRAVLRAADVKIKVSMARPSTPRGKGKRRGSHTHVVLPDDVDMAVQRWTTEECLPDAARRLGTTREILRAALLAAGHEPPPKRYRWRVMPETADAAMASYRPGMSVRAHAARLEMSRDTLAGRLRRVGALGEKRPGVEVRLTIEAVDKALAAFEAQQNPRRKRPTKGEHGRSLAA